MNIKPCGCYRQTHSMASYVVQNGVWLRPTHSNQASGCRFIVKITNKWGRLQPNRRGVTGHVGQLPAERQNGMTHQIQRRHRRLQQSWQYSQLPGTSCCMRMLNCDGKGGENHTNLNATCEGAVQGCHLRSSSPYSWETRLILLVPPS